MNDINYKKLNVGDTVIITVSRSSHYLTSATVIEAGVDYIIVQLASTIATKTVNLSDFVYKYEPKIHTLDGRLGVCRDCVGTEILPGDEVLYKYKTEVLMGKVTEVISNIWVNISGRIIRNEGVFVK